MFRLRKLKAEERHFIVLIALLTIFIYVFGKTDRHSGSPDAVVSCLSELDDNSFKDSISSGICMVLFYVKNSHACDKEIFHLSQIARKNNQSVSFFKVDVGTYPKCGDFYNISGVPSVLIFKNGKEKRRILGVVSLRNMEIIYSRFAKL